MADRRQPARGGTTEAPVVRAIRRDFAAASAAVDPDETISADLPPDAIYFLTTLKRR
jgi:hypothetical protein